MRAVIFRKMLTLVEKYPLPIVSRLEVLILMKITARAFGKKPKRILFAKNPLGVYALFTKECMKKETDRKHLYKITRRIGNQIRQISGFTEDADLQRLIFLLYRNIGIRMTGSLEEIWVEECYFSHHYSPANCAFISAMDRGIVEGLLGGGRLAFTQRLTQGCDRCRACYEKGKGK